MRRLWESSFTVGVQLLEIAGASFLAIVSNEVLALQLPFPKISESMGNHDSKIVDAGSVD